MDYQEIIAGTVGKENTYGTCVGLVKPATMSFARFSTDDTAGRMRGYVGEGKFTDDPLKTFGGAGVVEIPQMQKLLHYICENGSSITWRRIFRVGPLRSTRQPRGIWAGICPGTVTTNRAH